MTRSRLLPLVWILCYGLLHAQTPALVFPQIVDGGAAAVEILLTNPSARSETGTIFFSTNDGTPLPVSVGGSLSSSVAYSVPPGGAFKLETQGGAVLNTGFAILVPDEEGSPVTGTLIYNLGGTEISVRGSAPSSAFHVYVEKTPVADSALAVVNPGESPITLSMVLVDDGGLMVGSRELELAAGTQFVRFVEPYFGGLPGEFRGTLQTFSGGQFVLLGIRVKKNGVLALLSGSGTAFVAGEENRIECTEEALLEAIAGAGAGGGGTIRFNCADTTIPMSRGLGRWQDGIVLDGEDRNITVEYAGDFEGCLPGDNGVDGPPIAILDGSGNIVRGLTFKNFLESIQIRGPDNTIDGNTFLGHECSDDAVSIIAVEAIGALVQGNRFQAYFDKAFQINFGGGSIIGNHFLDTQQPIRGTLDNSLGEVFHIADNEILTSGDRSACTGVTLDGTYSVRFERNTLRCLRGLRVGGRTQIIVDGNLIEGNDRVGVRVGGEAVASLSNNRIIGNGEVSGSLPAGGVVVWETGQADLGGGSLLIDGEVVSSSGNNVLEGNGTADVRNLRSGYLLTAEANCWDHLALSDVETRDVEGNVDIDPLAAACPP